MKPLTKSSVQYENQSTNYGMAGMQANVGLGGAALGGFGAAQGMYGGMCPLPEPITIHPEPSLPRP